MKTVFITGVSSGIGKQTAKLFTEKGWNVIATMRYPQFEKELVNYKNMMLLPCDVTDLSSIQSAIDEGIQRFNRIDALVNNAGYYLIGPFETATSEQIERQINTNLIGLIETTKAIIPHFRKQESGTIINISSIAGVTTVPMQTLYHATKWGVEGFSESLQYELRPFSIKVKIIEPGVINTDFYGRSMTIMGNPKIKEYDAYSNKVISNLIRNGKKGSSPQGVAETIYKAANDNRNKMRYPTGKSKNLVVLRKVLPYRLFSFLIRNAME